MKNFLIRVAVNGVALWVAALVVSGVHLGEGDASVTSNILAIVLVALLFGLINAFIKPIVKLLSLPFVILTLGLFTFIVNAFMLQITEWIADWWICPSPSTTSSGMPCSRPSSSPSCRGCSTSSSPTTTDPGQAAQASPRDAR